MTTTTFMNRRKLPSKYLVHPQGTSQTITITISKCVMGTFIIMANRGTQLRLAGLQSETILEDFLVT